MSEHTQSDVENVISHINFTPYQTIIDIGGGTGNLLFNILNKNPHLKATLFDQKNVIEEAIETVPENVRGETKMLGGDFKKDLLGSYDCQLLKFILHDWPDSDAIEILKTCRQSINDHGHLYIIDAVIPPGDEPLASKWLDLHMFSLFRAKERDSENFEQIVKAASFAIESICPLPRTGLIELSIIKCQPI